MNIKIKLKKYRKYGRIATAISGFTYNLKRFLMYSAWKNDMRDKEVRNYQVVKIYHALEKSLSYINRNKNSGWSMAEMLLELILIANQSNDIGGHDIASLTVLKSFINHPDNTNSKRSKEILEILSSIDWATENEHGVKKHTALDFQKGQLLDPETFFNSRFSLRDYSSEKVDEETFTRVISLAMKTPSVCNRQAWHIYKTSDKEIICEALSHQNGNRGFTDKISNLLIISTDLKAFMYGQEHYQHWIDGGLFSMSLIYAFHSIGIASCCLNWSQSPKNDRKLRANFNIKPNHSIIMMLAFGYPNQENLVCQSTRRPISEVCTELEKRI